MLSENTPMSFVINVGFKFKLDETIYRGQSIREVNESYKDIITWSSLKEKIEEYENIKENYTLSEIVLININEEKKLFVYDIDVIYNIENWEDFFENRIKMAEDIIKCRTQEKRIWNNVNVKFLFGKENAQQ